MSHPEDPPSIDIETAIHLRNLRLRLAVQERDQAKMLRLLSEGADPDSTHLDGRHPLARQACEFDDASIMRILLEHGALRNPETCGEDPPALWCFPRDSARCLDLMIQAGVDVGGEEPHAVLAMLQGGLTKHVTAPKCAALLEAWMMRKDLPPAPAPIGPALRI